MIGKFGYTTQYSGYTNGSGQQQQRYAPSPAPVNNVGAPQFDQFSASNAYYPSNDVGAGLPQVSGTNDIMSMVGMMMQLMSMFIMVMFKDTLTGKDSKPNDSVDGAPATKEKPGTDKPAPGDKTKNKDKTADESIGSTTKDHTPKTMEAKGWNDNVSIYASANTNEANASGDDKNKNGYTSLLIKAMAKGMTLQEAHDSISLKNQTPVRNATANPDGLLPKKGGKALIVVGSDTNKDEADKLAASYKSNYGMEVDILQNATKAQMEDALKKIGEAGGTQTLITVLGDGAEDKSDKNEGKISLKGGDVKEAEFKDMINKHVAPKVKNVNVILASGCDANFID